MSRSGAAPHELAGAADRAGSMIRDQIAAMVEAAHGTAADIERQARDAANGKRSDVGASAEAVLEGMRAIERELTLLLRSVSTETDGLRAKLDQAQIRSGPSGQVSARQALASGDETIDPHAQSDPWEAPPEAEAAPEPVQASVVEEVSETETEDPGESELPAEETGPEREPMEAQEPPSEEPTSEEPTSEEPTSEEPTSEEPTDGDTRYGRTDEELRAQAAERTDLGLAELYQLATSAEGGSDAAAADYWARLARITVEEAAARPDFGEHAEEGPPGGRRAKKQRSRTLKPLTAAREQALQHSSKND